jgi:hypothetical protein
MGLRRVNWFDAREDIRKAVRENPSVSYLSAAKDANEGFCQIWAYGDCHFVTRVDANRDGRRLVVCLLGGKNLFEWCYELEKELYILAKQYQCNIISVEGRKGWERLMKPLGFVQESTTMVKRLYEVFRFKLAPTDTDYSIPLKWGRL